MLRNLPSKSGFTLIELLVVIAIIGVLASLALFGIQPAQKQARDTQRKSDIKQYQTSIESYANRNSSLYPAEPSSGGVTASTTLCTPAILNLTGCPEDPKYKGNPAAGWEQYKYQSDGNQAGLPNATMYALWAKLEFADNSYFVACSNGKSGVLSNVNGVSAPGGVCPLP